MLHKRYQWGFISCESDLQTSLQWNNVQISDYELSMDFSASEQIMGFLLVSLQQTVQKGTSISAGQIRSISAVPRFVAQLSSFASVES